jgi:two-component system sporulation sensor kinase A
MESLSSKPSYYADLYSNTKCVLDETLLNYQLFKKGNTFLFQRLNGNLTARWGFQNDTSIKQPIGDCLPEMILKEITPMLERAWIGEFLTTEIEYRGTVYLHSIHPSKDSENVTQFLYGVIIDITNSEHHSITRNQHLDSLFIHNPDGVVSINQRGMFTSVNDRACMITGYTREELLTMHFLDLILESEAEQIQSIFHNALNGITNNFTTIIYSKSGEMIHLSIKDIPIIMNDEITGIYCIAKDITQQKNVEEELWETKEKLNSIINNSADSIIVYDIEDRIIKVNTSFESTYGWNENELIGKIAPFIIDKEKQQVITNYLKNGGQISDYETTRLKKDGTVIDVSVTFSPLHNTFGKVIAYSGISRNITERKKAESKLLESEERYRLIAENTTDIISVMDVDGNILYASPSHEAVLGYTLESNACFNSMNQFHPDDLQTIQEKYKELTNSKDSVTTEIKVLHNDGHWVHLETNISPILNSKGIITSIVSVSRDITERKKSENQLKQSEERYRLIAENTNDLIKIVDSNGKIVYASPSHEQILGFKPLHYINKGTIEVIHPDDENKVSQVYKKMQHTKTPHQIEVRAKHSSGKYVVVEASCMPVLDDAGNIQSLVIVSRDITERRKTESLLRRSDKLTVLGELAAGIAHEIRNPLTSLRGFTQILKASLSEENKYFDIMLSELDRINSIVSEFMVLAKPQVMDFKKQDIFDIVKKVISLLEAQANLHNIQIIVIPIPNLPLITGVEDQLKQVFINLLKNAIEAMPKGGTIFINFAMKNNFLTVSFIDQGVGIDQDRLKSIGEPFYTTKEKGTGLGMMICHKIIENHFGAINIESKVNVGTTVQISLPIEQPD